MHNKVKIMFLMFKSKCKGLDISKSNLYRFKKEGNQFTSLTRNYKEGRSALHSLAVPATFRVNIFSNTRGSLHLCHPEYFE